MPCSTQRGIRKNIWWTVTLRETAHNLLVFGFQPSEFETFEDCEREGIVGGDERPVGGVAQVVCHGVNVVGAHGEEGQEKNGEVQGEVKGEVEESQGQPLMCRA